MNLVDDARKLQETDGVFAVHGYDNHTYYCIADCGANLDGGEHASDCPWLSMPKIVAALEERELMIASMARVWGKVVDDPARSTWKHYVEMADILYHATNGQKGRCASYYGPPCMTWEAAQTRVRGEVTE